MLRGESEGDMERQLVSRIGFMTLGMALGFVAMQVPLGLLGQNRANPLHLPKTPVSYPNAPLRQAEGVAAMKMLRTGADATISNDELKQFMTSNSAPLGIKGIANINLIRIDCGMTAGKVSDLLRGKTLGLAPNTSVCYAELNGDFTFPLPPSRRPGAATSMSFHKGFRVYDAKTGNIIALGAVD
jgi:hypothetical protein